MVYKNQNLIRNHLLKEEADKYQKDYVEPTEENDETNVEKVVYSFISYSDNKKTTEWGQGTVETTGVTENGYTQVKVLTNSTDQSFVNQLVYIISTAKTDGTVYQLYSDAGTTALGIYVTIGTNNESSEPEKTVYSFTSYSDAEKTTEWGQGTVETTGVTENGYTQVKVLTNSTDQSFVNQLVYIISTAKTDGTTYQLYSDAGTTALGIYVTVTKQ